MYGRLCFFFSGFLLYEAAKGQTSFLFRLFTSLLSIFFLVYLLFRIRIFEGADAKALIVIGILFPIYPAMQFHGYYFPLLGEFPHWNSLHSLSLKTLSTCSGNFFPETPHERLWPAFLTGRTGKMIKISLKAFLIRERFPPRNQGQKGMKSQFFPSGFWPGPDPDWGRG